MAQSVVIKSNKYGINLIMDSEISFDELLKSITEKFKESENFFKNSKLGISFEGRQLSNEEETKIIDAITENTSIEILCVMDNNDKSADTIRRQMDEYFQVLNKQMEQVQEIQKTYASSGDFYKGTLRSGQQLECENSITILGDVNPGAKIIAGGNIIVLGSLKGNAQAGAYGDPECFIFAIDMSPIQIQISEFIAKSPDKQKGRRHMRKASDGNTEAQIALVRDGAIYVESATKKLISSL